MSVVFWVFVCAWGGRLLIFAGTSERGQGGRYGQQGFGQAIWRQGRWQKQEAIFCSRPLLLVSFSSPRNDVGGISQEKSICCRNAVTHH